MPIGSEVSGSPQLDSAGETREMRAGLCEGASLSNANAAQPHTPADFRQEESHPKRGGGELVNRLGDGIDAAGVGVLNSPTPALSDAYERGSDEDRRRRWQPRSSHREDSAKSCESFTTAHAGLAGSGDETSGWSDGGDRHGPLRDMTSGPSYRRGDLTAIPGPKHAVSAHAAHSHAQDDDSVTSSRSRGSSASGSGSTVSSQSSRSSSSISSSSGGGWARRLGIWKRSSTTDGAGVGESTVDSLEELHHLTLQGQSSAAALEVEQERHAGAIWVVRASPDARLVATGGQCGLIGVWHVAAETDETVMETVYGLVSRPAVSFREHKAAVLDLAWSRDLLLLSASVDLTVRVWHTSSPAALRVFTDFTEIVTSVLFHPVNQQLILTGSLDGAVSIFDLRPPSGAPGACVSSVQTKSVVTALAISGDRRPQTPDAPVPALPSYPALCPQSLSP